MRYSIFSVPASFSDLLDSMMGDAPDVSPFRRRGTAFIFDTAAPTEEPSGSARQNRYGHTTSEPLPGTDEEPSVDPAHIAAALAIHPSMKIAELAQLRRSFAASNHPDRLPAIYRSQATERMKIANALIDEAQLRCVAETERKRGAKR